MNEHAKTMLSKYLPDGATIYATQVGRREGGNGIVSRFHITTVNDGRVVNLNLYIANLCEIRRDKFGSVSTRMGVGEIAEWIGNKLGRKINYDLI